jgi:hypothetical protein
VSEISARGLLDRKLPSRGGRSKSERCTLYIYGMIDSTHGNVSLLNKSRSKERSPKEHKGTDYAYTLLEQRRPKKKGTVMLPITFQLHECVPTALHTSLHDGALSSKDSCCLVVSSQL